MNITGLGQYSKQISAIRDPKKLMQQQHKLIFIYPMLFADKIKTPNIENFTNLMRDFISVTFLSDLFIQNLFSTVNIASQIRPLWDDKYREIHLTSAILKASGPKEGVYHTKTAMPEYSAGAEYSDIVQRKIYQKTVVIQQLLKTDPKLAKLRPFIEVITLGNMIEIPVIVGTAQYTLDTLTLMYTLIAAIGLNKKLDNKADLEIIFKELESLNEKTYWALLNNLTKSPIETISLSNWFRGKAFKQAVKLQSSAQRSFPRFSSAVGNLATRLEKRIKNPPSHQTQFEQPQQILAPLLLNRTNLDQVKLFFKFVLEADLAKRQFGIDTSDEATKLSDLFVTKLQGELQKIKNVTLTNFAELIGTLGNSLLLSVANLISIDASTVNVLDLTSQNIKILLNDIEEKLLKILQGIHTGLQGNTVEESRFSINVLKELCKIDSSESLIEFMNATEKTSIIGNDFNIDHLKTFIYHLNSFAHVSDSLSIKIKNQILYLVNTSERPPMRIIFEDIERVISRFLTDFFTPFISDLIDADLAGAGSRFASVTMAGNNVPVFQQAIPKFKSELTKIFYFMLLVYLQASLCKFILVADIDLETTATEVTSWPNYTLVLPVEIIMALHAATMGASWEHMLKGGPVGGDLIKKTVTTRDPISGDITTVKKSEQLTKDQIGVNRLFNLNAANVKGIMKFICNRLNIPNLIVVDSKRGEIYYKLMNQSQVNNTRLSTVDTFIQSKLNREMISQY